MPLTEAQQDELLSLELVVQAEIEEEYTRIFLLADYDETLDYGTRLGQRRVNNRIAKEEAARRYDERQMV